MQIQKRYSVPEATLLQHILDVIKTQFSVQKEPLVRRTQHFYDTFDWRLFNKSLVLQTDGTDVSLGSYVDDLVLETVPCKKLPKFVWDLPDSPLKKRLAPIVEMRALLPLFALRKRTTPNRILNEDAKTVVYLDFENISIKQAGKSLLPLPLTVSLRPVRGYETEAARVADLLEKTGLQQATSSSFAAALQETGFDTQRYSSKLNVLLQPDQRSDEAAKQIFRFLLDIIRKNEQGVLQDTDTEFLHDFRVAIRRTRSGLSQIKDVFAETVTEKFKKEFATIGKASNQLRDLDVYLLDADRFRARLPEHMSDDISPLFVQLQKMRQSALQDVRKFVQSDTYCNTLIDWQAFLNQPPANPAAAANAERPIATVARERINKRYRSLLKKGRRIDANSEDAQLHALRIDGKKLRYLLEFFASLFPAQQLGILLKQLKKLQDNLGQFQDLCVQEMELQQFIDSISLRQRGARKTIAAIGCLIGAIDREKWQVRKQFDHIFKDFASSKNKALFAELLSNQKEE